METQHWYLTLDWSMIWVCTGGVMALILFMASNPQEKSLSGVGNYFTPTWKNYAYQIVAAFVVLSFIEEVGMPFVESFAGLSVEAENSVAHFLGAISGIGGGFILAKVIRLFQRLK
jgi:hypothetical protein